MSATNAHACKRCRSRYQKCDQLQPICSRCKTAKQSCAYELDFAAERHTNLEQTDFNPNQTWLPIPPNIDFHLETFDGDGNAPFGSAQRSSYPTSPPYADRSNGYPARANTSEDVQYVTASRTIPLTDVTSHKRNREDAPFQSNLEIWLLRHYVSRITPFFDFFDAQAHFAFDVPSRARSKPMLANALLATLCAAYAPHSTASGD
ncbi:hypothetical protein WHR41_01844 [Cladosporium halotolerans]|uniref:Zn(2)-C6 fungal-type domain-containing protein n=1 Tax=Cladosporium halotolerans TaxID=1052096 RepID=A0AB34L160_9PEZI